MSWTRKFHLEHTLPDGNIWHGMINIDADTEAELYNREDIKGEFWAEKVPEGWRGKFTLECGVPDKRKDSPFVGTELEYSVFTMGIYRPESDTPQSFEGTQSAEQAEAVLEGLKPVQYESTPRFGGRLEDCIYAVETHDWDKDKKKESKKPNDYER